MYKNNSQLLNETTQTHTYKFDRQIAQHIFEKELTELTKVIEEL